MKETEVENETFYELMEKRGIPVSSQPSVGELYREMERVVEMCIRDRYHLDQAREKINPAYCALGLQMVFLIINYAIGKKFVSHLISAIRFW